MPLHTPILCAASHSAGATSEATCTALDGTQNHTAWPLLVKSPGKYNVRKIAIIHKRATTTTLAAGNLNDGSFNMLPARWR